MAQGQRPESLWWDTLFTSMNRVMILSVRLTSGTHTKYLRRLLVEDPETWRADGNTADERLSQWHMLRSMDW